MELVFSGSESLGPLSLPLGGRLKGTQKRARKRALLGPRWFARNRNNPFGKNGGDDETRTRDLCRDSDQWSGRWESNPVNQHYDGPLLTSKYWDSNNWAPPTRCAKARSGTVPSHDDNGFIIEWLYPPRNAWSADVSRVPSASGELQSIVRAIFIRPFRPNSFPAGFMASETPSLYSTMRSPGCGLMGVPRKRPSSRYCSQKKH